MTMGNHRAFEIMSSAQDIPQLWMMCRGNAFRSNSIVCRAQEYPPDLVFDPRILKVLSLSKNLYFPSEAITPSKKTAPKAGNKSKMTKSVGHARNLRSRAVKSENPRLPPTSPVKPRSLAKSTGPPKRATKIEARKKTIAKNAPNNISQIKDSIAETHQPSPQASTTKRAVTESLQPSPTSPIKPRPPAKHISRPKRITEDIIQKNDNEKYTKDNRRNLLYEAVTARTVITGDEPSCELAQPGPYTSKAKHIHFNSYGLEQEHSNGEERFNKFWHEDGMQLQQLFEFMNGEAVTGLMKTAQELTRSFMPTSEAPVPPNSPQQSLKMLGKCSCRLNCCRDGIPPVDAKNVSCKVCRTILEAGIPTVVCLPRQLTVSCSCERPLKTVIKVREKGKATLKMSESVKKTAVARAKAVITNLYEQQKPRYMAEVEEIRHTNFQDPNSFIASIFNQAQGIQSNFNGPRDAVESPERSILRPTDSPLKSPLRSPISPSKTTLKSPTSPKKAP
ncbi:hypothetical protein N431DRAFT_530513 [Stipitochalara longipes BDJ]|nr:hypothetical protein N431DRAFT_530513 [Stipitochalara longipes BDJ]